MVKKISFLFIGIILLSCTQKKSNIFTIEGTIDGVIDSTEIFLYYLTLSNEKWHKVTDKTFLINNKFFFEGNLNELCAAELVINNIEIPLYLEPTNIKLQINKEHPYNYKIIGAKAEKEYTELRKLLLNNMEKSAIIIDSIQCVFQKIDFLNDDKKDYIDNLIQKAEQLKLKYIINLKKIDSIRLNYVINHKTYRISPHLLYQISKNSNISYDTIEATYNKLPAYSKSTLLGKLAFEQITESKLMHNRKPILLGDTAPDFIRTDIHGEAIRLSNFMNKNYVLLDFWASWCAPCLKAIPELKTLYDSYTDKGLTIIGVSLDEDKKEYLDAIKKYHIDLWLHVFSNSEPNNNFFIKSNNIDEMYGVEYIPLYILIDKKGKVIGKWQQIDRDMLFFIKKIIQ